MYKNEPTFTIKPYKEIYIITQMNGDGLLYIK